MTDRQLASLITSRRGSHDQLNLYRAPINTLSRPERAEADRVSGELARLNAEIVSELRRRGGRFGKYALTGDGLNYVDTTFSCDSRTEVA